MVIRRPRGAELTVQARGDGATSAEEEARRDGVERDHDPVGDDGGAGGGQAERDVDEGDDGGADGEAQAAERFGDAAALNAFEFVDAGGVEVAEGGYQGGCEAEGDDCYRDLNKVLESVCW